MYKKSEEASEKELIIRLKTLLKDTKQVLNELLQQQKDKTILSLKDNDTSDYISFTTKIDEYTMEQLKKFSKQSNVPIKSIANFALEEVLEKYFDEEIDI